MRFLIDANLPRSAVRLLVGLGHFVDFARDIGLASATDEAIARRAQESAAALLTRDLDFSDIRRYPREHRYLDALPGRLAIVEPDRVRFRPPVVQK
jgi:predicted nuclease of predicted toxin-antitoxin system